MRLKMFLQIHGHLIFVCIYNLWSGICIEGLYHFKQSIGSQQIIMIHQSDIVALCHFKSGICIFCDPQVGLQWLPAYPRILCLVSIQDLTHLLVLWAAICNAKLPVSIRLCKDRLQHLF